jgi:hypothetical protein
MKSRLPSPTQQGPAFIESVRTYFREQLERTDKMLKSLAEQQTLLEAHRVDILATLASFDEGGRADA